MLDYSSIKGEEYFIDECGMTLVAVLPILLDPGLLLEGSHRRFGLAAEDSIHRQGGTHLVQELLEGLHIRARAAVLQQWLPRVMFSTMHFANLHAF